MKQYKTACIVFYSFIIVMNKQSFSYLFSFVILATALCVAPTSLSFAWETATGDVATTTGADSMTGTTATWTTVSTGTDMNTGSTVTTGTDTMSGSMSTGTTVTTGTDTTNTGTIIATGEVMVTVTVTDEDVATTEEVEDDSSEDSGSMYDAELTAWYTFGFELGLTTLPLEKARLYDPLTRNELAKMMSAFIKSVGGEEPTENPLCDITKFADYASFDDEMKMYVKMACNYGIMGWKGDKSGLIDSFRPFDPVTREEFGIVLARYVFGATYDGKPASEHLAALKEAGIMKMIDTPASVEIRGYVLIMLQRIAEGMASEDEMVDESTMETEEVTEATEDEVINTGTVVDEPTTETGSVATGTVTE